MFYKSTFNNNSISRWDTSNVTNFKYLFSSSLFDRDISSWKINEHLNLTCYSMFDNNKNFIDKYNNGEKLSDITNVITSWLKDNKEKMREINNPKEDILNFFSFDSNLNIIK